MDCINSRIREVFKQSSDLRKEITEKTGISSTSIHELQQEGYPVRDKNIKIICSVYDINEDWLRYGNGEMINYDKRYDIKMKEMFTALTPAFQQTALEIMDSLLKVQKLSD